MDSSAGGEALSASAGRWEGAKSFPPDLLSELEARFPADPAKLGPAVRALSDAYIRGASPPGLLPSRVAAYARYYLPANYLKLHLPLAELARSERADLAARPSLRVLDLGSGPGTFLLSLIGYLSERAGAVESLDLVACDRDPEFLGAAAGLVRFWAGRRLPAVRWQARFLQADIFSPLPKAEAAAGFDLIVLGNALCEWAAGRAAPLDAARQLAQLLGSLRAQGALVVIEPALKATSRFLLETRDRLLAGGGVHVYSPCLHEGPCPALQRPRDWCHERLAWRRPSSLQALDQAAGLEKDALSFSYLVVRREAESLLGAYPAPGPGARGRVVSDGLRERGKRVCASCTEGGRLVYFEALERPPGLAAAALEGLRRGDVGHFPEGRVLGDGSVRLPDVPVPRRLG